MIVSGMFKNIITVLIHVGDLRECVDDLVGGLLYEEEKQGGGGDRNPRGT